jgi:hypothetical protein
VADRIGWRQNGHKVEPVHIATFNCQWRKSGSTAASFIRKRIFENSPDIVCVTEAYADFFGSNGHVIEASANYGYPITDGRRKVMLWSRRPWTKVDICGDPVMPGGRFVAGTTSTPAGDMRCIGVCIPWKDAHVSSGRCDRRPWEDHLSFLEGLKSILATSTDRLVLVGDFNQRVPRKYQPKAVFDRLGESVLARLAIATAGVIEAVGAQGIDHICHSHDWDAADVIGLSNIGPDGKELSDHFGIRARLMPLQPPSFRA